jgi:hypothetical protein
MVLARSQLRRHERAVGECGFLACIPDIHATSDDIELVLEALIRLTSSLTILKLKQEGQSLQKLSDVRPRDGIRAARFNSSVHFGY